MLALVGSGEYLPAMEPVDRYLLGQLQGEIHVACLPTAAGTEGIERITYWSNLGVEHFSRLGAQVEAIPVTDRASANDTSLAERLLTSNFIYLSGGKPDYLYTTLKDSPVWSAILAVEAKGGIIAGCSAGAMIMGEYIPGFPGMHPAFSLLPGIVVIPHYDEIPTAFVQPVRLLTRKATVLGIEGYTAFIKQAGQYIVKGECGVTVWQRGQKKRYIEGQVVSLDHQ